MKAPSIDTKPAATETDPGGAPLAEWVEDPFAGCDCGRAVEQACDVEDERESEAFARWFEIDVDSVVLAKRGADNMWGEAEVVKVRGNAITLKWCDFPNDHTFVRRRHKLALMHP